MLRYRKVSGERDKQIDVQKKGDDLKRGGLDSGGKKTQHLVSGRAEEPEKEFVGEGGEEGGSENGGAAESGKKRCVGNGEEIGDEGVEKKWVKEKRGRW